VEARTRPTLPALLRLTLSVAARRLRCPRAAARAAAGGLPGGGVLEDQILEDLAPSAASVTGPGPHLRTRLSAVGVLIVNVQLDLGAMKGLTVMSSMSSTPADNAVPPVRVWVASPAGCRALASATEAARATVGGWVLEARPRRRRHPTAGAPTRLHGHTGSRRYLRGGHGQMTGWCATVQPGRWQGSGPSPALSAGWPPASGRPSTRLSLLPAVHRRRARRGSRAAAGGTWPGWMRRTPDAPWPS
jgi:hypothetical protein